MLRITPDTTQWEIDEAITHMMKTVLKDIPTPSQVVKFQKYHDTREILPPANGWIINATERHNEFMRLAIEAQLDGTNGEIIFAEHVKPSAESPEFEVLFSSPASKRWVNIDSLTHNGRNLGDAIRQQFANPAVVKDYTFDMLHPHHGLVAVDGSTKDEFGNELLWIIPSKDHGLCLKHGQVKFDVDLESFDSCRTLDPENIVRTLCHPSELMPLTEIGTRLQPRTDKLYQACSSNSAEDMLSHGLDEFIYIVRDLPRRGKGNPQVLVIAEESKRVFITQAWWLKDIFTGESYTWTDPKTLAVVETPKMFNYIPEEEMYFESTSDTFENVTLCDIADDETEDDFNSTTVENLRTRHNKAMAKINPPAKGRAVEKAKPIKQNTISNTDKVSLIVNHHAPYWMSKDTTTLDQLGASQVKVEILIQPLGKPKVNDIVAKVNFKFMNQSFSVPVYFAGNRTLEVRSGSEKSKHAMCRLVSLTLAQRFLQQKAQNLAK